MRNTESLDSRYAGIVRFDCDVLLHQYKTYVDGKGERTIQNVMFVEVKTHNADMSYSQRDTLGLLNQLLRNRRVNRHSSPRRQSDTPAITKAFSHANGQQVSVACWGGHLLQFSHNDPDDSDVIRWDGKPITAIQLMMLLRFELDPDAPERKIDKRRRYQATGKFRLPLFD